MNRTPIRVTLALCAAGVVAACGGGANWVPDGPESFKVGYVEGCMQGYADGQYDTNYPLNEEALANDPVYRKGWDEGHALCLERQRIAPMIYGAGAGAQT